MRVDPSQGFFACLRELSSRVASSGSAVCKGVIGAPMSGRERARLMLASSRVEGEARRADVVLGFTPVCEVPTEGLAVPWRSPRSDRFF